MTFVNLSTERTVRKLLNRRKLDAEAARRFLRVFVELGWPEAEPARHFIPNWHVDAISDHLQAVTEGHIRHLLITVPPGHAKSLIVSVLWPAWVWARDPTQRAIFASYSAALATRDSMRCRSVLTSDWFQEMFQPLWSLAGDQNEKAWFQNDRKGFRLSLSVGGKGTGFRGDYLVVDDPLNAREQHSNAALNEVTFWHDHVMSTRLDDPSKGATVVIMQQLSDRDLAGHLLARGGWVHLNLPTEYEPEHACVTVPLRPGQPVWYDPRTQEGEPLFPQLFAPAAVTEAKTVLGSQGFAAQHQQRPSPAEGGILKRYWWRFWQPEGQTLPAIYYWDVTGHQHEAITITLPKWIDEAIQSWDCAFKDQPDSDFVVGQVWGRLGSDAFLLDQVRGRMDFPTTLAAVRKISAKWPEVEGKLIEDKANGTAVIQSLCHELSGILPVEPLGGKVARARAISPRIEAGNVYLPHPAFAPWVNDLIEECAQFPNGRHDDQVDALSQALTRLNASPWRPSEPEPNPEDEDPGYFPG